MREIDAAKAITALTNSLTGAKAAKMATLKCMHHKIAAGREILGSILSAKGIRRVLAKRKAAAAPSTPIILVSIGSNATNTISLVNPSVVSFPFSASLFNLIMTAVKAVNGAMESSNILRAFAPPTSSGFMASSIRVGAARVTAIIGVARPNPILKPSEKGSTFLLAPTGSAALRMEPGMADIAKVIIRAM